ncbi:MAG: aminotransferase class I/II-fold pyridoxal phosphate-dependent enzyme [Planctomycetes bacterium]|nr:aminotransferase class I/II-fold pyridoxal phosphate-dependent enzyme [Planctomycetota bacterium]
MPNFSERVKQFEVSGIRKMFELSQKIKNPIDFSLGQPDFDAPDSVKEEAVKAVRSGNNRYTVTAGIKELRDGIKEWWQRKYGVNTKDKEVIVTGGATGSILLSLLTIVNPGDEILIPDPYFVLYGHLVRICGGVPVYIDTYPNSFKVMPADLDKYCTSKTKAIILNNPINPTGVAYTESEIKLLASVVKTKNIFVISDEVYSSFMYDFEHTSFLRYCPENAILVSAFSKTHGVPGWRIGYAVADPQIITHMITFQQFTYVCANSVAQRACLKGLSDGAIETKIRNDYRVKRDLTCDILSKKFEFIRPQGAFYIFPKAPGGDADSFVQKALDKSVIVVPGKTASRKNSNFRISYAVDNNVLKDGLARLVQIASA